MNDWQKFENKRYLDAKDLIAQATAQVDQGTAKIKGMRSKLLQIKLEEARKHAAFHAARDDHKKDGTTTAPEHGRE